MNLKPAALAITAALTTTSLVAPKAAAQTAAPFQWVVALDPPTPSNPDQVALKVSSYSATAPSYCDPKLGVHITANGAGTVAPTVTVTCLDQYKQDIPLKSKPVLMSLSKTGVRLDCSKYFFGAAPPIASGSFYYYTTTLQYTCGRYSLDSSGNPSGVISGSDTESTLASTQSDFVFNYKKATYSVFHPATGTAPTPSVAKVTTFQPTYTYP